jgi:hypothetical protein
MIVRIWGHPQRIRPVWNKWWFRMRIVQMHYTVDLVENVSEDGMVVNHVVKSLANFSERRYALSNETDKLKVRVRFWKRVRRKLDALGARLTPEDREKAEDEISSVVPKPTAEEVAGYRSIITDECRAK